MLPVSMDETESVADIIVGDDEGRWNGARSVWVSNVGNFRANSQAESVDHGTPFGSLRNSTDNYDRDEVDDDGDEHDSRVPLLLPRNTGGMFL